MKETIGEANNFCPHGKVREYLEDKAYLHCLLLEKPCGFHETGGSCKFNAGTPKTKIRGGTK